MGAGSPSWYRWPSDEHDTKSPEDQLKTAQYQREVNQYLLQLLGLYNDRDIEQIQTHLTVIENALNKEIEGTVELSFGGSVSKHTYVNGLSDIDMIVILDGSPFANSSPQDAQAYFAERLRKRLPASEIKVGRLAVTISFSSSGHEIQLLPAITTKTGVRISDSTGDGWSPVIHPEKFAQKLTQVNRDCSNRVVPVIKLVKGLNSELPKTAQLKGYHMESLAIEAFRTYNGALTMKDMVQHFCKATSTAVLSPIVDSTGQSVHVDEYLGGIKSHLRQMSSGAWERLGNKLSRADTMLSLDEWKGMFGQ